MNTTSSRRNAAKSFAGIIAACAVADTPTPMTVSLDAGASRNLKIRIGCASRIARFNPALARTIAGLSARRDGGLLKLFNKLRG
jgi:hypothetical protein